MPPHLICLFCHEPPRFRFRFRFWLFSHRSAEDRPTGTMTPFVLVLLLLSLTAIPQVSLTSTCLFLTGKNGPLLWQNKANKICAFCYREQLRTIMMMMIIMVISRIISDPILKENNCIHLQNFFLSSDFCLIQKQWLRTLRKIIPRTSVKPSTQSTGTLVGVTWFGFKGHL